ncbi:MAG TPA: efflux transporter periplasmic adaptor subunit, partial [Candidatus Brocadiia bacterium]|nr:efflux transporter periplasmic adaptor subunit [Candidatus Brocadiia bacterium]
AADLAPGMFARVRLVLETAPNAVTIPSHAVIAAPGGKRIVYVVEEGKAVARPIKTGIEQGGRVQALSGLKPGEKVVVTGGERLKDGVEVLVAGPGGGPGQPGGDEAAKKGKPAQPVAPGAKGGVTP